jgi:hypothetical protein
VKIILRQREVSGVRRWGPRYGSVGKTTMALALYNDQVESDWGFHLCKPLLSPERYFVCSLVETRDFCLFFSSFLLINGKFSLCILVDHIAFCNMLSGSLMLHPHNRLVSLIVIFSYFSEINKIILSEVADLSIFKFCEYCVCC